MTETNSTRYEITCWTFHICNRQCKSWLSCSVSSLIASDVDMTWDPAHNKSFASICESYIVLNNFLDKILFQMKSLQSLKTWHRVWKSMKFFSLLHGRWHQLPVWQHKMWLLLLLLVADNNSLTVVLLNTELQLQLILIDTTVTINRSCFSEFLHGTSAHEWPLRAVNVRPATWLINY